ncbi:MAG: dATP/dGTP diphosphohydrolase domain-containing protein [Cetobacterium sp.]
MNFIVKDSGEREVFSSGMQRDTTTGKVEYWRTIIGPMFWRLAEHLTKGAVKYPDVKPGIPNWTLATGEAELLRFRQSAFRHFLQWYQGEVDEDHAAAVFFNINGAEYVRSKLGYLPAGQEAPCPQSTLQSKS